MDDRGQRPLIGVKAKSILGDGSWGNIGKEKQSVNVGDDRREKKTQAK